MRDSGIYQKDGRWIIPEKDLGPVSPKEKKKLSDFFTIKQQEDV